MRHFRTDGGRSQYFSGEKAVGDCVTRAIAIATQRDYLEVYKALAKGQEQRGRGRSARNGVGRKVYQAYLESIGWEWVPTMKIGQGCQVHLREDELPTDRTIIVRLSRHLSAVVHGVIYDSYDPSRGGNRCVYGYFQEKQ